MEYRSILYINFNKRSQESCVTMLQSIRILKLRRGKNALTVPAIITQTYKASDSMVTERKYSHQFPQRMIPSPTSNQSVVGLLERDWARSQEQKDESRLLFLRNSLVKSVISGKIEISRLEEIDGKTVLTFATGSSTYKFQYAT